LHNWKKEIKDFEIHLVNSFAEPVIRLFNYEMINPARHHLLPVKGEKLDRYVKNRSLLTVLGRW